jgi:hypothetical protein
LHTLARGLLEKTAMPVTPQNLATVEAALKAIQKGFDWPYPVCCDWLVGRVEVALKSGVFVNRFWFEDGKYRGPQNHGEKQDLELKRVREECKRFWKKSAAAEEAAPDPDKRPVAPATQWADPNCPDCSGSGIKLTSTGAGYPCPCERGSPQREAAQ